MFGHFRRYTKPALEKLFEQTPTEILHSQYWDILGVLPWWVSFVLLRCSVMSRAMVKLYDAVVVPLARVLEGAVQPPVGKNVLLVAQKKSAA
jgi:hypothetical protein